MLFRPSYCANCGEKIERAEWHFWTSRRFCELCAIEFRGIDLLPKAAVLTGVLGIAFAVSGYVGRGPASAGPQAAKQAVSAAQRPSVNSADPGVGQPEASPASKAALANLVPPSQVLQRTSTPVQASVPEKPDGPVYICGAQTKKGTPCSRRVKGNVRCFQHTGMPAMLPPDKLRVG
jgi:hypothetical protein